MSTKYLLNQVKQLSLDKLKINYICFNNLNADFPYRKPASKFCHENFYLCIIHRNRKQMHHINIFLLNNLINNAKKKSLFANIIGYPCQNLDGSSVSVKREYRLMLSVICTQCLTVVK